MNWAREFMGVGVFVVASVVIVVAIEWWARRSRVQAEVTRKLMHLAGVVPCLFIPVLIHTIPVAVALAAVMAAGLWAGDRFGHLRSVSEVSRRSHGAMFYPLAMLAIFLLAGDRTWMFLSALLAVGVADALAALVGSAYGKRRYRVWDAEKSLEGSAVFFMVTLAAVMFPLWLMAGLPWPECLLAALLTALITTGLEAVSSRGLDNLLVPIGVCVVLNHIVGFTCQKLWVANLVLWGLVIGTGVIARLTRAMSPVPAVGRTAGLSNISVWDRHDGTARMEPVYRAGMLHFLFGNPLGRLAMRTLLSTRPFNNLITARQRGPRSKKDIMPFIERYQIDRSEFVQPVSSFASFADFFVRELRPDARPIAAGKDAIVAPCDGRIQWWHPALDSGTSFEVKGITFTLGRLMEDDPLAASFVGGSMLGIYLSPCDYHRFCYPADGELMTRSRVGNRYFSVNAESLAAGFRAFDCNVRQSTVLARGGQRWAMIEVAGFYAGGIVNLDAGKNAKTKGMMKGYFRLGGSFIVLAFQAGAVRLDQDILDALAGGTEVRVRLGERIGVFEPQ
jgi:phosphatidylserine decarboxylase